MAIVTEHDKTDKLITATRNTFIKGKLVEPGEVVNVDAATHRVLVGAGKAELAPKGATEGKAKPAHAAKADK